MLQSTSPPSTKTDQVLQNDGTTNKKQRKSTKSCPVNLSILRRLTYLCMTGLTMGGIEKLLQTNLILISVGFEKKKNQNLHLERSELYFTTSNRQHIFGSKSGNGSASIY